jgi:hypothetical protein
MRPISSNEPGILAGTGVAAIASHPRSVVPRHQICPTPITRRYAVVVLKGHATALKTGIGWRIPATMTAAALTLAGCGLAGGVHAASPAKASHASSTPAAIRQTSAGAPDPRARLRTSCHSVVHIGDSTSDGLVLPAYQPIRALRIAAQYRRVGVRRFIPEVSGARSIVETWHGFPNGYTVAQQVLRTGYRGCWVIALGTNDTADVAVGSAVGLAARIQEMMSLIGPQPVMWVNVKTLLNSGPYAEARMRLWDHALLRACPRYPNMRVYDWAAAARRNWFINDGIHYTPEGYAWRSRLIADALARAFPAAPELATPAMSLRMTGRHVTFQPSCLVH